MKDEWKYGPPPHVGWWNSNFYGSDSVWRWWDGRQWGFCANESDSAEQAGRMAESKRHPNDFIRWRYYYPKDARVPRIDPAIGSALWHGEVWVLVNGKPEKAWGVMPPKVRPNKPTIQVGEFLIAQADNDPLTTYITNTTTGEGGGFRTKRLAAAIGEFFNREF